MNLFSWFKPKLDPGKARIHPLVLLVLDGFGVAPKSAGNPISQAKTPNLDSYKANYPYTELIASGESVGLPANEVGNSEVGHLTIGAGRVIYQHLKRINTAINDGSFFGNKALLQLSSHLRTNRSNLHLMGLVGSGNVHSATAHLFAILEFCKRESITNVFLHLFTDGRDAPPQEAKDIISKIQNYLNNNKIGTIATISGRYYAMDRDRRWERTKMAYDAIVNGQGLMANSAIDAIQNSYTKGATDEFIQPTVIVKSDGSPVAIVNDNDAVIFFNFRIDRPVQLTMAFTIPDFENLKSFEFGYVPYKEKMEGEVKFKATFARGFILKNVFFATMTEYHKNLPVSAVLFGPIKVDYPLAQVLSEKGLFQLRLSESEKEKMVTYYFDGLRESPFANSEVLIVPSPKVPTYDKKPEMSVAKIVDEFKKALARDRYHFFIINFANPDMVAHSGDIAATIKALEAVDSALKSVVENALAFGGAVVVTADHGNAEELRSFKAQTFFYTTKQGEINTGHSGNPVPLIVIDKRLYQLKKVIPKGTLADVAPTILSLLGIATPSYMTGKNLLQ